MTETAYDKNHTDIMACIGYICVQWALLEQILLQTIFVMQDLESTEGEICFGGLDIQPRVNLAINLAKHQKAPKKIINELKEIISNYWTKHVINNINYCSLFSS
mgnify:CR=1 FL=1